MEHREYVRVRPGADTAVLFIHGIVGTPNHFVTQIPLVDLVPEEWSLYNLLLDGHGKDADDFTKTSMKKWKAQVWGIFDKLCATHERVIIVAHSMGTLFAMQLALERPEKVPFLFLIAIPMRPWLRFFGAVNSLRLVFGLIREDRPLEVATRNVCGLRTTRKLWKYIGWVPRYLELFREISVTEKILGDLNVPCIAFQSERDELVSNRTRTVLEKSGKIEIRDLPHSTHFYYDPRDQQTVRSDFVRRCNEKTHD